LNAHEFRFPALEGGEIDLADFRGRPVLIVNTASECGFTRQYAGLQQLWERYRERGLAVIGVPSNDFGEQEPGTGEQIREFCTTRYGVSFPLSSRQRVIGEDAHGFFRWLEEQAGEAVRPKWNFHKFLVGADGGLREVWPSKVEPLSDEVISAVERELGAPGGGV